MKFTSRCRLLSLAGLFAALVFSQALVEGMSSPAKPQKVQGESVNKTAVVVDGVRITEAAVEARIKEELDKADKQIPSNEVEEHKKRLRAQVLDDMIVELLLDEQANKAGITVTDSDVNDKINENAAQRGMSVSDYKSLLQSQGQLFGEIRQIKKTLVLERLIGQMDVTDALAFAFYQESNEVFNVPEQVRASHILFKPDPNDPEPNRAKAGAIIRAQNVLVKAKMGSDFGTLAQKNSDDIASREKGGDVGFFAKGKMARDFEDVAFAIQAGQVSEIIELEDGYHIIKVTGRKPAVVMPFEEARPIIVKTLGQKIKERKTREYIEKLKTDAQIVYPPGKEPIWNFKRIGE